MKNNPQELLLKRNPPIPKGWEENVEVYLGDPVPPLPTVTASISRSFVIQCGEGQMFSINISHDPALTPVSLIIDGNGSLFYGGAIPKPWQIIGWFKLCLKIHRFNRGK